MQQHASGVVGLPTDSEHGLSEMGIQVEMIPNECHSSTKERIVKSFTKGS
jgi:hypothetical protein